MSGQPRPIQGRSFRPCRVANLQSDPFELDNIIQTEPGRAVLPAVQAELARLQVKTGYGEPPR